MARKLEDEEALQKLFDEMTYTLARLKADSDAADLAPAVEALRARIEAQAARQRAVRAAVVEAHALVDAANQDIDQLTRRFAGTLDHLISDRTSARFRRYFQKAPSEVIRQALETQLKTCRTWPTSLRGEPEEALSAFAALFEAALAAGDAAIATRAQAEAARTDHRVREINPLVEELNQARLAWDGQLRVRAAERGKPRTWAASFFRTKKRRKATPVD